MKESIIAFVRGFVGAGIAVAVAFVTANLDAPADKLLIGAAIAFLTGAIAFIGQYLRDNTPHPTEVRTSSYKRASKLDWLPF